VNAKARVVLNPTGAYLEPGEILVAPSTDSGWTPLFSQLAVWWWRWAEPCPMEPSSPANTASRCRRRAERHAAHHHGPTDYCRGLRWDDILREGKTPMRNIH